MRVNTLFMAGLIALFFSGGLVAAGGGGMSGGSSPAPTQPKKTPEQMAVDSYNQGLAARDKAHEYEALIAVKTDAKAIKKLNKKINKQYAKAAKRYRRAIKYVPRLYQAHGSLGYALKQQGKFEEAMIAYDESLRLRPEYTPAIEYRAEAHLALARYEEVQSAFELLDKTDMPRRNELRDAIAGWLQVNEQTEKNAVFHLWAMQLEMKDVAPDRAQNLE